MKNPVFYDENTLYCFSPTVMLLTFLFEFISAGYILISGKLKNSEKLIIAILFFLGLFQLAEYQVCSTSSLWWMRVGYISTSLLPPLGIHLVTLVTKQKLHKNIGYLLSAIFIGAFLASSSAIQSAVCGGNYIMISTSGYLMSYYFPYYYYLLLIIGLLNIFDFMRSKKYETQRDDLKVSFLSWVGLGYAAFLVPTGAVYLLSQADRKGLPSIMCGFAVFLALILVFRVYPISRKLDI